MGERLLGQLGECKRHTGLPPERTSETEILECEVESEADVVAAVEDDLPLGLVDEARPGARRDHFVCLRQIEARPLREHERLSAGDEVDERKHVGDHLEVRGATERADMEDATSHRLEERHVRCCHDLVAADDHRDLTRRCQMDAAGDGCLERRDPELVCCLGKSQQFMPVVRAHVDPCAPGRQPGEDAVLGFECRRHRSRRRKACDHDVDRPGELRARVGPAGARGLEAFSSTSVAVVYDQGEPGTHEAGGEMSAEPPDPDEADAHQPTTGSSAGVR